MLVSPTQSNANDTIEASDINTPVNQLAAVLNGNVDTTNLADNGVSTSKIADSAVTPPKLSSGMVVQIVSASFNAVATGTTVVPNDDTIPQNTEGDQYMTLVITPKSATNILVIEFTGSFASSVANDIIGAIFQDSTANAIAAAEAYQATANGGVILSVKASNVVAGTTSATTFKLRVGGSAAGTTTFNGAAAARRFGAITKSNVIITEYRP